MSIRAVVLDVGNVVIPWDPEAFYDRALGEGRRRALFAEVDLAGMNARVDAGAPWEAEVRALAALHPEWSEAILHWHGRWLEMLGPPIEGTLRLMRALRARGVPLYALTNFGRETWELALRHYPILSEFDGAVVSGRVGLLKPQPAIYEAVERLTGLPAEAHLFADDREENVAGAFARGWAAHLFRDPEGLARRLAAEGLIEEARA